MIGMLKKLWKDEEGVTAVEYALMGAAICGVIIAIVFILGTGVSQTFSEVDSAIRR